MDVIACHRAGIAAAAPMGTALTESQMELLWRLHPEPTLAFDADAAGLAAASRTIDRALPLLKPGRSFAFALLDGAKDPDEVYRELRARRAQDPARRRHRLRRPAFRPRARRQTGSIPPSAGPASSSGCAPPPGRSTIPISPGPTPRPCLNRYDAPLSRPDREPRGIGRPLPVRPADGGQARSPRRRPPARPLGRTGRRGVGRRGPLDPPGAGRSPRSAAEAWLWRPGPGRSCRRDDRSAPHSRPPWTARPCIAIWRLADLARC